MASEDAEAQVKVLAKQAIEKGHRYGPYKGKVTALKSKDDEIPMGSIKIPSSEADNPGYRLDSNDFSIPMWLRFIKPAADPEAQTITVVQIGYKIFFEVTKDVAVGTEHFILERKLEGVKAGAAMKKRGRPKKQKPTPEQLVEQEEEKKKKMTEIKVEESKDVYGGRSRKCVICSKKFTSSSLFMQHRQKCGTLKAKDLYETEEGEEKEAGEEEAEEEEDEEEAETAVEEPREKRRRGRPRKDGQPPKARAAPIKFTRKKKVGRKRKKPISDSDEETKKKYVKDECNPTTKDQEKFPFECDTCDCVFPTQSWMDFHKELHATPALNFMVCNLCDEAFRFLTSFNTHVDEKHPELDQRQKVLASTFRCDACKKPFRSPIHLERHRQRASQEECEKLVRIKAVCCHCGDILDSNQSARRRSLGRRLRGCTETGASSCKLLFGSTPGDIKTKFLCSRCFNSLGQMHRAHQTWDRHAGPSSIFGEGRPKTGGTSHQRKKTGLQKRVTDYMTRGKYVTALNTLYQKGSSYIRSSMLKSLQYLVRREVDNVKRSFPEEKINPMKDAFQWRTFLEKVRGCCPLIYCSVTAALTTKSSESQNKTTKGCPLRPIKGGILATILHQSYPRRVKNFQVLNGLQLYLSGAKRKTITRFNKLGLCSSNTLVLTIIDEATRSFDEPVKSWRSMWEKRSCQPVIKGSRVIPSAMDVEMHSSRSDVTMDDWQSYMSHDGVDAPYSSPSPGTDVAASSTSGVEVITRPTTGENVTASSTSGVEVATSSPSGVGASLALYTICSDNVNISSRARHGTLSVQNQQINLIQSFAVRDRVPVSQTTVHDVIPSAEDIMAIPMEVYLPTRHDIEADFNERSTVVGRIITTWLTCFKGKEEEVSTPIAHSYLAQSALKSEMVPLGVQMKDECKVGDVIEFLSQLNAYIPHCEQKAPTKVLIFGDGSSCERLEDAKRARMSDRTPSGRLRQFEGAVADWDKRVLLLQDAYDELLVEESAGSLGTMCNLKNVMKQRSAKASVKNSFDHSFDLMDMLTEAYVVAAAMDFLGLQDMDDGLGEDEGLDDRFAAVCEHVTRLGTVPPTLQGNTEPTDTPGPIGDDYPFCLCKEDEGGTMVECGNANCKNGTWFHLDCVQLTEEDVYKGSSKWFCSVECEHQKKKSSKKGQKLSAQVGGLDSVHEYTRCVLWHGLTTLARRDAIKQNDGPRILRHWKIDMIQFFRLHHYKYMKLAATLLASVNGAMSPRLAHQLTWSRTVNPSGQPGGNVSIDLQMEHFNRVFRVPYPKGPVQIKCKFCEKSFTAEISLENHTMRKHPEHKKHQCTENNCEETFENKDERATHLESVHGTDPKLIYRCPVENCIKAYTSMAALNYHYELRHTTHRPFTCEICGKTWVKLGKLRDHLKTHSTEKNELCDLCGRAFKTRTELKDHKTDAHTEEGREKITCRYCPATFSRRSSRSYHERRHRNDAPYVCPKPGCNKSFVAVIDFKRHLIYHTGAKLYRCRYCSNCFTRSDYLKGHEKRHHLRGESIVATPPVEETVTIKVPWPMEKPVKIQGQNVVVIIEPDPTLAAGELTAEALAALEQAAQEQEEIPVSGDDTASQLLQLAAEQATASTTVGSHCDMVTTTLASTGALDTTQILMHASEQALLHTTIDGTHIMGGEEGTQITMDAATSEQAALVLQQLAGENGQIVMQPNADGSLEAMHATLQNENGETSIVMVSLTPEQLAGADGVTIAQGTAGMGTGEAQTLMITSDDVTVNEDGTFIVTSTASSQAQALENPARITAVTEHETSQ